MHRTQSLCLSTDSEDNDVLSSVRVIPTPTAGNLILKKKILSTVKFQGDKRETTSKTAYQRLFLFNQAGKVPENQPSKMPTRVCNPQPNLKGKDSKSPTRYRNYEINPHFKEPLGSKIGLSITQTGYNTQKILKLKQILRRNNRSVRNSTSSITSMPTTPKLPNVFGVGSYTPTVHKEFIQKYTMEGSPLQVTESNPNNYSSMPGSFLTECCLGFRRPRKPKRVSRSVIFEPSPSCIAS